MKAHFSVNQHDKDGDSFDDCILLHVSDTTILRFDDIDELEEFRESLERTISELRENYFPKENEDN